MDNMKKNKKFMVDVKTLSDILKSYKESDKTITYMKIDIEGSELEGLKDWIKTDALKNVQQIGIEWHTGSVHIKDHKVTKVLKETLLSIKEMCQKYGFKIIDYTSNGCVGKSQDKLEHRFHTYFDIVLYKP